MEATDIDISETISSRFIKILHYAGASALLISAAHLHSGLWFIFLLSLVSFLWLANHYGLLESFILAVEHENEELYAAMKCIIIVRNRCYLSNSRDPPVLRIRCYAGD